MNGPNSGFPDYGCTLASLGVSSEIPPITPASLTTPGMESSLEARNDELNRQTSNGSGVTDQSSKGNRFRFDAASTRELVGSHQHHGYIENQNGDSPTFSKHGHESRGAIREDFCRSNHILGSQGNLHSLPHHSCTSITQNLSTSDQQPLIVDAHYDRSCYHYVNTFKPQPIDKHLDNRCCLETTTSFMGAPNELVMQPDLTCCSSQTHNQTLGRNSMMRSSCDSNSDGPNPTLAIKNNRSLNRWLVKQQVEQNKSRTLTKIYKPLNDADLYSNAVSTNNLYVPSETKQVFRDDCLQK